MNQQLFLKSSKTFSRVLAAVGAVFGGAMAVFALSGDADGEVNLFWLLLLFVVIPIATLFFSLYALRDKGFRVNWLDWPLAPLQWLQLPGVGGMRAALARMGVKRYGKHWFIYQAQIFYMAFSVACLVVFIAILAFSHVVISWSSTLFFAGAFLPVLKIIALPWFFLGAAQPTAELFECTYKFGRDCAASHWWPYVVAVIVTYNIIPRLLLLWYARFRFIRGLKIDNEEPPPPPPPPPPSPPGPPPPESTRKYVKRKLRSAERSVRRAIKKVLGRR